MIEKVNHENCGSTKWTCSSCKFTTRCDVEAMAHEHEYLNAEISLTNEQVDRCFGINKKEDTTIV